MNMPEISFGGAVFLRLQRSIAFVILDSHDSAMSFLSALYTHHFDFLRYHCLVDDIHRIANNMSLHKIGS